MLEFSKKTLENIFPYLRERRGFRTLSRARRQELLSQLKSSAQETNRVQTKPTFLNGLELTGASLFSPILWTTLWLRLRTLPRALYVYLRIKLAKKAIEYRNRPMKFVLHPDPRLKRIAESIDFSTTSLEERIAIVRKMHNTLNNADWGDKLGLAAPQIGINKRVIIVRGNVMFNPEWNPSKAPKNLIKEGCYSVPGKNYNVERAPSGWAKWTNIEGRPFEDKLNGLPAIVFQHEIDHLNGLCCADIGEETE